MMLPPEVANFVVSVSLTLVSKSDASSSIPQNIREVRCEIISSPFSVANDVEFPSMVVIPHRKFS